MWVERAERWERGGTKWFRTTEKTEASSEAGRQLIAFRAFYDWMIWKKWEVLDFYADADAPNGNALDNRTVMALGRIKADLMRLGVERGGEE